MGVIEPMEISKSAVFECSASLLNPGAELDDEFVVPIGENLARTLLDRIGDGSEPLEVFSDSGWIFSVKNPRYTEFRMFVLDDFTILQVHMYRKLPEIFFNRQKIVSDMEQIQEKLSEIFLTVPEISTLRWMTTEDAWSSYSPT